MFQEVPIKNTAGHGCPIFCRVHAHQHVWSAQLNPDPVSHGPTDTTTDDPQVFFDFIVAINGINLEPKASMELWEFWIP